MRKVARHFHDLRIGHLAQVFFATAGVVELFHEVAQISSFGFFLQHVAQALADTFSSPAQMHFQHLPHVHT